MGLYLNSEERAKRDEWLKTLKPGDEVAEVHPGGWGDPHYYKVKITKITPTGRINTENRKFDNGGEEIGRYNRCHLAPWTDEIEAELERRDLVTAAQRRLASSGLRRKVGAAKAEDLRALIQALTKFEDKEEE